MNHVVRVHPPSSQDRAMFVPRPDGAAIVLADGAGGTARGAEAAQLAASGPVRPS
jgi:hypothetical protein